MYNRKLKEVQNDSHSLCTNEQGILNSLNVSYIIQLKLFRRQFVIQSCLNVSRNILAESRGGRCKTEFWIKCSMQQPGNFRSTRDEEFEARLRRSSINQTTQS